MDLVGLYKMYAHLFADRFRGFECQHGGASLIDSTLSGLQMKSSSACVVQIKTNFASLRMYLEMKKDSQRRQSCARPKKIPFQSVRYVSLIPGENSSDMNGFTYDAQRKWRHEHVRTFVLA